MKLQINDKIFNGRYNDKQELVISLDNNLDIQLFKEWEDRKTVSKWIRGSTFNKNEL